MPGKRKKRRPARRHPQKYWLMPKIAFVIFAVAAILIKTGYGQLIETSAAAVWSNMGSIAQTAGEIVFPSRESESAPPDIMPEDELPEPGHTLSLGEVGQLVYENNAPELWYDSKNTQVASLTIDGKNGEYQGSGTVYIKNETGYEVDINNLLKAKSPVNLTGDMVQVLIMHTHGTEAYTPTLGSYYTASDTDRTTDSSYNMIAVGEKIASVLTAKGIKVIHSKTLNDYPAYSGAYSRALEDITAIIKDNPSIKIVIDVHRDAIISASGVKYKTVASVNGQTAAQLLLVCGTDAGGLVHNNWQKNLTFQLKLHDRLNTKYPGIMRPLNIRESRFNQHVTAGSMILEVGTCGNTLDEALYSAGLFAETLAEMLK